MKQTEQDRERQKSIRKTVKKDGGGVLAKFKVLCDRDALILQFMKNFQDQNQRLGERLGKLAIADLSHFDVETQDHFRRSFAYPGSMKIFFENLENSKVILQKYAEQSVQIHKLKLIQTFEQMLLKNRSTWKKHNDQLLSVKSAVKDSKRFFVAQFKNPAKTKPADQTKSIEQLNESHKNYVESFLSTFNEVKFAFEGRGTELHDFIFQYVELLQSYSNQFQDSSLTSIPISQFYSEISQFYFQDNILLKTSPQREVFKFIDLTFEDSSLKIIFQNRPVERPPSYLFFATVLYDFEAAGETEITVSKGDFFTCS